MSSPWPEARYVEAVGPYQVANVHGRMTAPLQAAVIHFWQQNGAIGDPREAVRRAAEVVHLGMDAERQIIGVNTCYTALLDRGKGPAPYWFYRQFVDPRARGIRLSLALVRLSIGYFHTVMEEQHGPVGLAMLLENPKLYRRSGRQAMAWLGMTLAVRDPRGVEIWAREF